MRTSTLLLVLLASAMFAGVPTFAHAAIVFLTHADGIDGSTTFTDSSGENHTITANGNAQVDTADYKFATGAALLDGSGDSLSLPAGHSDWAFGTNDFTIDAWVKTSDSTGTFFCWRPSNSGLGGNWLYWYWSGTTNYFSLGIDNSSSWWSSSTSTTIYTGAWSHLALTRSSGTVRAFVDGVQIISATANASIVSNSARGDNEPNFGGANNCGSDMQGSMDEIRIVKGDALWTSNFTPPGEAYRDIVLTETAMVTGSTTVFGTISKGSGTFMIDHPLDPVNKLLYHSFLESPDVKNLYDGIATLDRRGRVTIRLPKYFLALNKEFRYLASPISEAMPNLHIKKGVRKKYWLWGPPVFTIAGGTPGGKISWQVTGIRKDRFIMENPITVEVNKGADQPVDVGECIFPPLCER